MILASPQLGDLRWRPVAWPLPAEEHVPGAWLMISQEGFLAHLTSFRSPSVHAHKGTHTTIDLSHLL